MFNNNLGLILLLWLMVLAIMATLRRRKGTTGVGLVLGYMLTYWMLYWAASTLYVLPWYQGHGNDFTITGTQQAFYGVLAFAFGSVALAPMLIDSGILPRVANFHAYDRRLPKAYVSIGIISYGLLNVFMGQVLSLNAILSAGQELVVVGLSLCCWQAWREGDRRQFMFWLAISLTPPLLTIITRGFIGYGAVASISVLIFLASFVRRKSVVLITGFVLGYIALSVFVTYMRDRVQIRASVWGGEAYSDRFDRVSGTFSNFEFFDPTNSAQLQHIDGRLNQSYLVGAAIAHLEENGQFAKGETLWDALLAMVPRVFWPDKPITAGSGNLVSRFTGINFDAATSVGIGQVMEFYVNFGTTGVLIGFAALGLILTVLDVLATERLATGDLQGFVLFYLPGLAFLQVGGQLVEVTASAAASLVVAIIVNKILSRMQAKAENAHQIEFARA